MRRTMSMSSTGTANNEDWIEKEGLIMMSDDVVEKSGEDLAKWKINPKSECGDTPSNLRT